MKAQMIGTWKMCYEAFMKVNNLVYEDADKALISAIKSIEDRKDIHTVGRYSVELDKIVFNEDKMRFETKLDQYVIDTLAAFMKQLYQEREVSRINKQVSIVTKDISIDGAGHTKTSVKNELDYCEAQSNEMIANQKPTAYD